MSKNKGMAAIVIPVVIIAAAIGGACAWILFINSEFLLQTKGQVHLWVVNQNWGISSQVHPMVVYLCVCLGIGFVIGFISPYLLFGRGKSKKLKEQNKILKAMEKEIQELKNRPAPEFSLPSDQDAPGEETAALEEPAADKEAQGEAVQ